MKLLCWMHRKFRQNTNEALKALVIGQSSLDDQQYFPKPNYGSNRPLKQVQRDHHNNNRKSFTGLEAVRVDHQEEDYYEEESSDAISDLFHGFLAIGTLGSSDQIMTEHPATPTFSISVENITEKETEVTENELKLINDELEKVLSAEAPDDGFNEYSSGRNSHVSNGRSSHGSIITLSGKGDDGNGTTVCPLQGYLFGSAIELSETTTTVGQAKKEHRTSLGELFQRSKAVEESGGGGWKNDKDVQEKRSEKEGGGGGADKSAMNMMKKKLKKKMLHASSRSSTAAGAVTAGGGSGGGGPADSAPTETKLHKILHMFHRKVHPETSASVLKSGKPQKNEQKKKTTTSSHEQYGGQVHPADEDITLCPQRALFLKQKIRRYRSQSNPPQFTFGSIDSNGNREQWIKTDADYLVLEL